MDNSGTIDYGEFVAAMLHLNKIEREDHLFAAFSYFDKDGSGYITADELQQACEEFGIEDARLEEMIQDVDQDNVSGFLHKRASFLITENGIIWFSLSFNGICLKRNRRIITKKLPKCTMGTNARSGVGKEQRSRRIVCGWPDFSMSWIHDPQFSF